MWKDIKNKLQEYKYVCMFGVGARAKRYYKILKTVAIRVDYFCDNNSIFWGKEVIDCINCISPECLYEKRKNVICLIGTSEKYDEEIINQLVQYDVNYVSLRFIRKADKNLLEEFFHIKLSWATHEPEIRSHTKYIAENERVAVYTAIFGNYDDLKQPLVTDNNYDYYCISDEQPENLGIYHWIDSKLIIPLDITSNIIKNRYCKFLPHLFFENYKYSIYVDGNIIIKNSLKGLIEKLGKIGIGVYGHPDCNDTYAEALFCFDRFFDEDGGDIVLNQIKTYNSDGFLYGLGFTENSIFVREHTNIECIRVMEEWWKQYTKYPTRDQLSFMYTIWKLGYNIEDLSILGMTWRNSDEFQSIEHKVKRQPYGGFL